MYKSINVNLLNKPICSGPTNIIPKYILIEKGLELNTQTLIYEITTLLGPSVN